MLTRSGWFIEVSPWYFESATRVLLPPPFSVLSLTTSLAREIESVGMLLVSDGIVPSLVSRVVGSPVKGSWWGHKKGKLIFNLLTVLLDGPDVFPFKLLSGKVTLVHARLWPALVAIGLSHQGWQLRKISALERTLLDAVQVSGTVLLDHVPPSCSVSVRDAKTAADRLESSLLLVSQQHHTETGRHTRQLESWSAFVAARSVKPWPSSPAGAQDLIEQTARAYCDTHVSAIRLPWGTISLSRLPDQAFNQSAQSKD